jgi:hypothetical protein
MKINATDKTTFGTYLGLNLQEKVLLAKQRNLFSKEHLANLEKIENDGLFASLDITKTYTIHRRKNGKSIIIPTRHLTLENQASRVKIDSLNNVYVPTSDNNNVYFYIHKLIKIFSNEYNLAEKIKQAFETLG